MSEEVPNPLVAEFHSRKTDLLCVDSGLSFTGAVTIPLSDLPSRSYELPVRGGLLKVLDTGPEAHQAVDWLETTGRAAALEPFTLGKGQGRHGGERILDDHVAIEPSPRGRGQGEGLAVSTRLRLWSPNDFLMSVLPEISPGRAIDLGCGTGRDAVALACCGWDVTGVDILPDALGRARLMETRYSTGRPITWIAADISQAILPGRFDLYVLFRFLDRPLLEKLTRTMKPGASIVLETFTTLHRERHGKPSSDRHVLQLGELPNLIGDLVVQRYEEGWHGDVHTARIWATKPGPPLTKVAT